MPLRFHWRLVQGGEGSRLTRAKELRIRETALPDFDAQLEYCLRAEESGIDSVLVDLNFAKPDPITLSMALGTATTKLTFLVAARSGLLSPTLFTQQINTLSVLTNGRVSLNIVAGHSPLEQRSYGDFLPHGERYARTAEFLSICRALWSVRDGVDFNGTYFHVEGARLNTPFVSPGRTHPEILIGGNSEAARNLAISHGTCWMQFADTPEHVAASVSGVLKAGKDAGLRLSILGAPTRADALEAARHVVESVAGEATHQKTEGSFVQQTDSVGMKRAWDVAEREWLTPCLWTGAVRTHGATALALVGSYEEIASALIEFGQAGVSQFILSGWPKAESMLEFGRHILPLVREKERAIH